MVKSGGHQRRAGFLKQLAVLSKKNFKLKKSQTCCCCSCPFVPICFELLLPVALRGHRLYHQRTVRCRSFGLQGAAQC